MSIQSAPCLCGFHTQGFNQLLVKNIYEKSSQSTLGKLFNLVVLQMIQHNRHISNAYIVQNILNPI